MNLEQTITTKLDEERQCITKLVFQVEQSKAIVINLLQETSEIFNEDNTIEEISNKRQEQYAVFQDIDKKLVLSEQEIAELAKAELELKSQVDLYDIEGERKEIDKLVRDMNYQINCFLNEYNGQLQHGLDVTDELEIHQNSSVACIFEKGKTFLGNIENVLEERNTANELHKKNGYCN